MSGQNVVVYLSAIIRLHSLFIDLQCIWFIKYVTYSVCFFGLVVNVPFNVNLC